MMLKLMQLTMVIRTILIVFLLLMQLQPILLSLDLVHLVKHRLVIQLKILLQFLHLPKLEL